MPPRPSPPSLLSTLRPPPRSPLSRPLGAHTLALRLTLVYLLGAAAWILLSDGWVNLWADSAERLQLAQTIKGLVFVLLTATLIYLGVQLAVRHVEQSDRRWRHLLGSLQGVAWFSPVDPSGQPYVSPTTRAVYGREAQEFLQSPDLWLEVVHPDDRAAVEASAQQLSQLGSRVVEYRVQHTNGSERWLRDRAALLKDKAGRLLGMGGITEDITAQREALQQQRDKELQLAGVVETAMDAIITVDSRQTIRLFNHAAARTFAVPQAEAIGQPLSRFIPPHLHAAHQRHVDQFATTGSTSRRMGQLHTLTGVRASGEVFPIEASISKVGEGPGLLMTVVLRDVTEQRLAAAAHQAQVAAEAASRAKTEFLSRMSHELRTPLNAVLGFSQLLQTDTAQPLAQAQRAQVEHIRQAGWHLLALIDDVLDVSRIESGRLRFEACSVALQDTIDQALALCNGLLARHPVVLQADYRQQAPLMVWGDPIRLRQVLVNLLSNAIKYNRAGGEVRITTRVEQGLACLSVADAGAGMSPEQLAHLYEPFNRLGREHSAVEGTGIGLLLTRQLVEHMGGQIVVDSRPGQGTTVQVKLPLGTPSTSGTPGKPGNGPRAADAAGFPAGIAPCADEPGKAGPHPLLASPPAAPTPSAMPMPDDTAPGPSGRVLYIEDNPVNMLVVAQLLLRWPQVQLLQADTGASGLALARVEQPDLVLLDMKLPDIDGPEVLKALRSDPATAGLQVVALSASAMPEDLEQARRFGAQAYWTKPLDFDRFLGDVAELLARPPGH